mgnify:FL=1
MKTMKYFIVVCFILNFQILFSFFENSEILEADQVNRKSPVLSNFAFIRIKADLKNDKVLSDFTAIYKAKIISPLLPVAYSVRYNEKIKERVLSDKNQNIEQILKAEEPLLRTYLVQFDEDISPELFCSKISSACSDIELAEPYYVQMPLGEFIPNDPMLEQQMMFETMQVYEAFDVFKGDTNVVIGISDTGIMQGHEDLLNSIWKNNLEIPDNGLDDDGNGYIDDWNGINFSFQDDTTAPGNTFSDNGHGTAVAGIAAATTNNGIGISGLAFNCRFFPMKTSINGRGGIIYGYQSLIYAAMMGFDVLNCSWGSTSYSCVAQSVIDYAVSRDVAIVGGSGNHGASNAFYPAGYNGVLGVGVTNYLDTLEAMSSYGPHCKIVAPGTGTWTTWNNGAYAGFCCTSGASPIVAAAVTLIRAKHQELNARQALEFARQATDDITSINPNKKDFLPGRINFLKAVTKEPFSTPSIALESTKYFNSNNKEMERFNYGDTVTMRLNCFNYLGAASNLSCKLSVLNDENNEIEIIDSTVIISNVLQNNYVQIADFKIVLKEVSVKKFFFRVDLIDENSYKDFFLFSFNAPIHFTNITSDSIKFSACDNGRIGFYDTPNNSQGVGFSFDNNCSMLFEGSLIVTENMSKIVNNARNASNGDADDDFVSVKKFVAPEDSLGIFSDNSAPEDQRLNIELQNKITTFKNKLPCVRFDISVKNNSDAPMQKVAAGYYFDWDIGLSGNDNIAIFNEENNILAITRNGDFPVVAHYVDSKDTIEIQLAAFDNSIYNQNGFTKQDKIELINSGISKIVDYNADIGVIVGARFENPILPNEYRTFSLYTCCSQNYNNAVEYIKKASDTSSSDVNELRENNDILVYPIPASDFVFVEFNQNQFNEIRILSPFSQKVIYSNTLNSNENAIKIDLREMPSGMYFIQLKGGNKILNKALMIVK